MKQRAKDDLKIWKKKKKIRIITKNKRKVNTKNMEKRKKHIEGKQEINTPKNSPIHTYIEPKLIPYNTIQYAHINTHTLIRIH